MQTVTLQPNAEFLQRGLENNIGWKGLAAEGWDESLLLREDFHTETDITSLQVGDECISDDPGWLLLLLLLDA